MSRYLHKCPNCGATIVPTEIPFGKASCFPCPSCGDLLQVVEPHSLAIWISSILVGGTISYSCGLRGLLLFLAGLFGSPFLYLMAGFVMGLVGTRTRLRKFVPRRPSSRDGELSLHLRDNQRR